MNKPMSDKLIISLIERGAIKKSTHLTAKFKARDLSGSNSSEISDEFALRTIIQNEDGIFFVASRTRLTEEGLYKIPMETVLTIDGMEPRKLAEVYNLRLDGTHKEVKLCPITGEPVRRGRKPKWVKEKMAEMEREGSLESSD